jgi:hypothetical protein
LHKKQIMKKILSIIALAGVITLSSCGGGGESEFEADVRKMAEMTCKKLRLATDTTKKDELMSLSKEYEDLQNKMDEKYKDKKDDKAMEAKAEKIMTEVMLKCK